jgi:hypothetical protein
MVIRDIMTKTRNKRKNKKNQQGEKLGREYFTKVINAYQKSNLREAIDRISNWRL